MTIAVHHHTDGSKDFKSIYRLGGVAALLAVVGTVLDIVVSSLPGWGPGTVPSGGVAWLVRFQTQPLLGLYQLDLLNLLISCVFIPAFLALFAAHYRTSPAYSVLALMLFVMGTTLFVSNNAALPMLDLGRKYALAATDAERSVSKRGTVLTLALKRRAF